MTEEEKKRREEEKKNRDQLLLALFLLLNPEVDENSLDISRIPSDVRETLNRKIDDYFKKSTEGTSSVKRIEDLTKTDILKTAQEISGVESRYYMVVTVGDEKTCEKCKQWDGKVISDDDPNYPSYSDFEKSGAAHPNCRCYLKPVEKKAMNTEDNLNEMAMNSEPIKDEIVYRGFVDAELDTNITYDFGETLVMITPVGEFVGSSQDGKATKEIVDEESLKMMETQTEEILLDRDHSSMRNVTDRDTSACGWISGLKAVTNLGDMSGLYAIIKWTSEGIRLVQDRIYRFLSPVFELDENGRAVKLINVGLTNRPALKMMPIINSESNDDEKTISITKEKDMEEDKKTETTEEVEVVENECKEVKNEETVEEKIQEAVNEEEDKIEKIEKIEKVEEKEVIKEEVLNSAPVIGTDISGKADWENLHGKAFFDWIKANKGKIG